jgi:hypothetical protein
MLLNTDEITGRRADLYRRYILDAEALAGHLNDGTSDAQSVVETAFTRLFARFDHRRDESTFELILFREIVELSNQFGRDGKRLTVEALRRVLELSVAQTANILGWSEARVADVESELPEETAPPAEVDVSRAFATEGLLRVARRAAWRRDVVVGLVLILAVVIGVASWGPWRSDQQETNDVAEPPNRRGLVFAGKIDDKKWNVRVHKVRDDVCMDLNVAREFETSHCLSTFDDPMRAFVDPDRKHETTFIFGYALKDVASLTIRERSGAPINVELVPTPDEIGRKEPAQMFVVTLPEALLHLSTVEQGESLGYQIYHLRLVAKAKGAPMSSQEIILGRPTS